MKTSLLALVLLGIVTLNSHDAASQTTSKSIQGVWQVVEVTMTGPSPSTITVPEPRPNLTIITARRRRSTT